MPKLDELTSGWYDEQIKWVIEISSEGGKGQIGPKNGVEYGGSLVEESGRHEFIDRFGKMVQI